MDGGSFAGGLINLASWLGNVILPIVAVLAVMAAVYTFSQGGDPTRYLTGATAALLCSALVALMAEFATTQTLVGYEEGDQYYNALLNLVNWSGNVLFPLWAGLEICKAALAFSDRFTRFHLQDGWVKHVISAGGFLSISALTRLLEYFVLHAERLS